VPIVPPFDPTKIFCNLSDARGQQVNPEIQAKIDKGFFQADSDWTCYRRNYFSVACAYSLKSDIEAEPHETYLHRSTATSQRERVAAYAICIAAKVDGEEGKAIELVQHTPKRDKGPMIAPEKKELKSNPSGNLSVFSGSSNFPSGQLQQPDYDSMQYGANSENNNVANFERIQFKKATANNGKRRAAQQYFHIVVELFAKVAKGGKSDDEEWVKVAHRMSAQMVVRGRSPGHYSDERRGSSTSMGGAGGSGSDYTLHRDLPSSGLPRTMYSGMGGGSTYGRMGGSYQSHHTAMTNSPPSDTPSIPSSASSIASGTFMDSIQTSIVLEDTPMHDMYDQAQFENHLNPNPARSSAALRATLGGSPPMNMSPFIIGSPTLKSDPPGFRTELARQPRLSAPFSSMAGTDWMGASLRDCRSSSAERNRNTIYSPMHAL
jgi:meiosis-specific transcription factor NDT80